MVPGVIPPPQNVMQVYKTVAEFKRLNFIFLLKLGISVGKNAFKQYRVLQRIICERSAIVDNLIVAFLKEIVITTLIYQ